MSEPLIRFCGVRREFAPVGDRRRRGAEPVVALAGVDLEVHRGERWGIVGESGSGKSTLLRLLMGLDRPTSGTVEFDGRVVDARRQKGLRFLRESVQMVFQDPMSSLDPRMRVRDIVLEPLQGLRLPGDHEARLRELLDAVSLPRSAADRYPHQFSGGQRQRIAIARALAPRPVVLVADEPVSALDVSVRAQILNLVLDLTTDLGLTLLLVSHDLGVVRHVCDKVVVMRGGQVVETGDAAEVYAQPQHPYTAELLAAVPELLHIRRPARARR